MGSQPSSETGRPDDGTDPKGPSSLQMPIDRKPRSEWRAQFPTKAALEDDMRKKIEVLPGVPTNFSQVIQDNVEESLSGVKGEISVKIFGPDLNVLEQLATATARVIAAVPGAADVAAIKVGGQTEVRADLDRSAMARLGLNPDDANNAISTAFGGTAVGTHYEGDRKFDIVVRFAEDQRNAIDDLAELQIPLPAGGTVSLGEVAHIHVEVGASRISREGGGRNVAVKANVDGRDQGGFVAEAQSAVAAKVILTAGYRMAWGGQFENQQRATKRLELIVPIALLGVSALLFWAFGSVQSALLVLAMVPFTMIGGAIDRLRPILMTALMAGLGLLPAALSTGIGSETQRPFACVIVGGVVSATMFMPVLLPLALERLNARGDTGNAA